MKTLKQVWISESGNDIYAITLESASLVEYNKVKVHHMTFPAKEHKRHTMALTYFGIEDLQMIYETIGDVLQRDL